MQLTLWTPPLPREVADRPCDVDNRHPSRGPTATGSGDSAHPPRPHGMFGFDDERADMTQGATLGPPVPEVDPQPLGETTAAGRPFSVHSFRWLFGGQAASVLGDRL